MTTNFISVNNFKTTLVASASTTDTTLTLESVTGLPTSFATDTAMPLTLQQASNPSVQEICYVTAISGNVVTVERAQEGTSAQSWNIGDYAFVAFTAGTVAFIGDYAPATGSTVYAPLDSPNLTGTPTAPTPSVGTTTNQIATADMVTEASNAAEQAAKTYLSTTVALGNSGSALTIDPSQSQAFTTTLTENCTISFGTPPTEIASFLLELIQGSGAPYTVTWPSGSLYSGGNPPQLSTSAGAIDLITCFTNNNGTNWFIVPFGLGMAS